MNRTVRSLAAALVVAGVSTAAQGATVATFDVSVGFSGTVTGVPVVGSATVTGGGGGGTGVLDDNGIFSVSGLNSLLITIGTVLGGANLDWAASGNVVGSYASINATTSSLSGNTATLNVSENSPCAGFGLFGSTICGLVPDYIDISQPFIFSAAQGLPDPLNFDLANNSSFVFGDFGGAATLTMNLSNPVVSPVPIPAAVWLFGTALIGLIGFGRRQKSGSVACQ